MYVVPIVFFLLGVTCLMLTVAGLPGVWVLLLGAVIVELMDPFWLGAGQAVTFGWIPIVLCLLVALVGEGIEFLAGAWGVQMGGGSRRGMIGAVVGGVIGAVIATPIIPIVGTFLGAFLGTFAGAMFAEVTGQESRKAKEALGPALWATVGRAVGTMGKVAVGLLVWSGLMTVLIARLVV